MLLLDLLLSLREESVPFFNNLLFALGDDVSIIITVHLNFALNVVVLRVW